MNKKFLKFLRKLFTNFWFRVIGLCLLIVGIFAIAFAVNPDTEPWRQLVDFLTSGDVLSIFLAAMVSLIIVTVTARASRKLEESLKIEDDHHKIVCKYSKHSSALPRADKDFYTPDGAFMYLTKLPARLRKPRNPEPKHSDGYLQRQKDINSYLNGKLYLPSVNVYANVLGNTPLLFEDSAEMFLPPKFIRDNALQLMEAHRGSVFSNNETIRLDDVSYNEQTGALTLKTERSQYFDMLITNRCMDYKLQDLLSVREVYESGDTVSPLGKSQLGNQLGINGLVFTRDGYLLVEKRGFKKAIWKNKFAQPISLAMKKSAILEDNGTLSADSAQTVFEKIVRKTLADNFGLECFDFAIERNFLGIARDLLEGGKPNIYLYVTVDMTAVQLQQFLQDKAQRACERCVGANEHKGELLPKFTYDKLDSDYYLIPYEALTVNYNYELSVPARNTLYVKRRYAPMVTKRTERLSGAEWRRLARTNGQLKRECGEALLACLYYADVCRNPLNEETK